MKFLHKLAMRALHHGHEVAPAIIAEISHLNLGLVLVMVGILLVVFGVQALIMAEA